MAISSGLPPIIPGGRVPHNFGAMNRSRSRPPAAGKTVQRRRLVSRALVEYKRRSGCAQPRGAGRRSAAAVFPPHGLSASGPNPVRVGPRGSSRGSRPQGGRQFPLALRRAKLDRTIAVQSPDTKGTGHDRDRHAAPYPATRGADDAAGARAYRQGRREQRGDLTAFVVVNVLAAARRVLADRETFVLNDGQRALWDDLNARPARALAGVRTLMERPSPFTS